MENALISHSMALFTLSLLNSAFVYYACAFQIRARVQYGYSLRICMTSLTPFDKVKKG